LTSACLGFLVPLLEAPNAGLVQYPISSKAEKFGSFVILTEVILFTDKYTLVFFFYTWRTETAKRSTGRHSSQLQAAAWNRCFVWKSPLNF